MENTSPNTAVVYYSRSGHSERLASALADRLNGTLIRMSAPRYTGGFLGYLRAGFDSLRHVCVLAPQTFASLAKFDQMILCGPVWASYPATPLRALLHSDIGIPQRVALFLTSGSNLSADKAWAIASEDLGRSFTAKAVLGNSLEGTEQGARIFDQFLEDLGAGPTSAVAG